MKTDLELQRDVQEELNWEPSVNAAGVGVIVKDGVVTIEGRLDSLAEKWAAERAAKRVAGVKALAVEVEVVPPGPSERTDADIARAAEYALQWSVWVPVDHIKVMVEKGRVTLEGQVDSEFQRIKAENAIRRLKGVKGILNEVTVKPLAKPTDVKAKIEAAFKRSAILEAQRIVVKSDGATVTLTGSVRNWAERNEAERAAWAAPGVTKVNDFITTVGY